MINIFLDSKQVPIYQAHPTRQQAVAGFARENQQGIALDAPERNYRDDNHKPECICAVSPMWAMNGFRRISDMLSLLDRVCPVAMGSDIEALACSPDSNGLRRFFKNLMTMDRERKTQVIREAVSNAAPRVSTAPCYDWIIRLQRAYPADIGILSPVLLNLVCLKPGEAMYLEAGELHAYLDGVGMELMANSDNVLRGGLTPKHVDVPELLGVLNFEERTPDILEPKPIRPCEKRYETGAEEFSLSVIEVSAGRKYCAGDDRGVEILFCTEGRASVRGGNESAAITQGSAVLVPAAVGAYQIAGEATLYRAMVP